MLGFARDFVLIFILYSQEVKTIKYIENSCGFEKEPTPLGLRFSTSNEITNLKDSFHVFNVVMT